MKEQLFYIRGFDTLLSELLKTRFHCIYITNDGKKMAIKENTGNLLYYSFCKSILITQIIHVLQEKYHKLHRSLID